MSDGNKEFLEVLNEFYDYGLLKEVYRTEKAIVCNAFNQYYIAFSLDVVQQYTKDFPGYIMLRSRGLLDVVRKDNWVNEYYGYLSRELKAKVLVFLNEDLFEQLSKKKEEFAQHPPKDKLNLEFEREVMEKGKEAVKGWRWRKYIPPLLFDNSEVATDLPTTVIKENKAFLELLNKFYENGLLKEVYRSEKAIVCNVFNQYYIAFPLDIVARFSDHYPAYAINSKGLRYIVEDDSYVLQHYQALSEEMQDKSFVVVDENLFRHMLEHKSEYSQRPPKDSMDLEFEQELMLKGADALK